MGKKGPTKKALRRQKQILSSKAYAQRAHAKRRMKKRHQVEISREGLEQMVTAIQRAALFPDHAKFHDSPSNRVSRWHVRYEGKWYPVVYDNKRKTIVTVLPTNAFGAPPEL